MTQIRIDAIKKSNSGKAWQVRSGNDWYTAYLDSGIDAHVGKVLEVDIKTFGKDGKAIDKYKVMGDQQSMPSTPIIPSPSPQERPQAPISGGVAPWYLPFASNTVNAAISAGLIKEPTDIKQWVFACKGAAEAAASDDVNF